MSPTSRFFVSEPEPFVSAGGPVLAGFHGEEIVLANKAPPENKKKTRKLIIWRKKRQYRNKFRHMWESQSKKNESERERPKINEIERERPRKDGDKRVSTKVADMRHRKKTKLIEFKRRTPKDTEVQNAGKQTLTKKTVGWKFSAVINFCSLTWFSCF